MKEFDIIKFGLHLLRLYSTNHVCCHRFRLDVVVTNWSEANVVRVGVDWTSLPATGLRCCKKHYAASHSCMCVICAASHAALHLCMCSNFYEQFVAGIW